MEEPAPLRGCRQVRHLLQLTARLLAAQAPPAGLDPLIEILGPHGLAVELRHRNWVEGEQRERTLDWYADRGVTFVGVDAPPG